MLSFSVSLSTPPRVPSDFLHLLPASGTLGAPPPTSLMSLPASDMKPCFIPPLSLFLWDPSWAVPQQRPGSACGTPHSQLSLWPALANLRSVPATQPCHPGGHFTFASRFLLIMLRCISASLNSILSVILDKQVTSLTPKFLITTQDWTCIHGPHFSKVCVTTLDFYKRPL